ncbi:TPA: hypothetical protein ACTPQ1_004681 [Salmonella enterica]
MSRTINAYSLAITPEANDYAKEITQSILPLTEAYQTLQEIILVFGHKEKVFSVVDTPDELLKIGLLLGDPLSLRQTTLVLDKTMQLICNPMGPSGVEYQRWNPVWLVIA